MEIKNIESGQIVLLNENSAVVSPSDGNIVSQNMTSEDFQQVDDLNEESGEYEEFDIDTGRFTGYGQGRNIYE